ncbi:NAD(P)H-hydrate dehydratase [Spirochaeta thermophila]|nr:NAD(P)H-hydrate dehydratase [Spirochaeta thermophila]
MRPLVSVEGARRVDARTREEYGVPELVLMEQAGMRLHEVFREVAGEDGPVVYVCGSGNNGGDAMVMARWAWLEGRRDVRLVLRARRFSEAGRVQARVLERLGVPVLVWEEEREEVRRVCREAGWVVEGVLGVGARGGLAEDVAELFRVVGESGARVFSVDVPGGVGCEGGVRADVTAMVGVGKWEVLVPAWREWAGELRVVPIGFPPEVVREEAEGWWLGPGDVGGLVGRVRAASHKGERGRVGVWAGSRGLAGAALLSARAAARTPAGLVYLCCDEEVYGLLGGLGGGVVVRPGDEGVRVDAAVVGPGWGRGEGRVGQLAAILGRCGRGVIDADGLEALARLRDGEGRLDLGGRWVLTPHPGECARLAGCTVEEVLGAPGRVCGELARGLGAVVVLKAHTTWVVAPSGRVWVYDGMCAPLGTGGAGDVLAGVIGGLLAHGVGVEEAACAGVVAHGEAGRRLFARRGWFGAEDLVGEVGTILKDLGVDYG